MAGLPAGGVEASLLPSHLAAVGEAVVGSVVLRVDYERWGQRSEDLHDLAVTAPHARSRERFLALYEMTAVGSSATRVAIRIGRHPQSVMLRWLRLSEQNFQRISGAPAGFKLPRFAEAG